VSVYHVTHSETYSLSKEMGESSSGPSCCYDAAVLNFSCYFTRNVDQSFQVWL